MTNLVQLEQSREELVKNLDDLEVFRQKLISMCEELKQDCQSSTKVFKLRKVDRENLFNQIEKLTSSRHNSREYTHFKNVLIDESQRTFLPDSLLENLNEFNEPDSIPECQVYEQDLGSFLLGLNMVALQRDRSVELGAIGEKHYDELSAFIDVLDPKIGDAIKLLLLEEGQTVPDELTEFKNLLELHNSGESVERYDSLKNEVQAVRDDTPYFYLALIVFSAVDALISRMALLRLTVQLLNKAIESKAEQA